MEGQENIQEILSKQLLLCQFLTALSTLRTGLCVHQLVSRSVNRSHNGSYLPNLIELVFLHSLFNQCYWLLFLLSCLLQVATLSVRPLTSLLPSAWVWSTCYTSASKGSPFSNLSPAGLPTLRGKAASACLYVSL